MKNEGYIYPTDLFRVLRARAERQRQKWIEPPKFPESITDSIRALENILSCGHLRNLDRMGDVVQPRELPARRNRRPANPNGKHLAAYRLAFYLRPTDKHNRKIEHEVRATDPRDEPSERPHDFTDIHGPRPRTPVPFSGDYH